jgi:hypothetical protein
VCATSISNVPFNEHCDEILAKLGIDEEGIIDLKVRGVVA